MRRETGIDFRDEDIELRLARGSNRYQSGQHVPVLTRQCDRTESKRFQGAPWRARSEGGGAGYLRQEGQIHKEISRLLRHKIYANRTQKKDVFKDFVYSYDRNLFMASCIVQSNKQDQHRYLFPEVATNCILIILIAIPKARSTIGAPDCLGFTIVGTAHQKK